MATDAEAGRTARGEPSGEDTELTNDSRAEHSKRDGQHRAPGPPRESVDDRDAAYPFEPVVGCGQPGQAAEIMDHEHHIVEVKRVISAPTARTAVVMV